VSDIAIVVISEQNLKTINLL